MNPEVVAALLGAALAGLASLGVQLLGTRQARSHAASVVSAGRVAEFLAATHTAVLAISRMAALPAAPEPDKDAFRRSDEYNARVDRVNNALNAIQLLEIESVVRAAQELDYCLITLENEARARRWDTAGWDELRNVVISPSVTAMVSAGRSAFGRRPVDRTSILEVARTTVASRLAAAKPREGSDG